MNGWLASGVVMVIIVVTGCLPSLSAIQFYEANDGRIGPFGPGGDAGLTS